MSAKIGPASTKFMPVSTEFDRDDQSSANLGPASTKSEACSGGSGGRICPNVAQNGASWARFGQIRPNSAKRAPESVKVWAELDHFRPEGRNLGRCRPELARNSADLAHDRPM